MRPHRLFIIIGTDNELSTLPSDMAGYHKDGWLVMRPELTRYQQLKLIEECMDDIGFWSAAKQYAPPVIPAQRFAPIQAFYLSKAVQS